MQQTVTRLRKNAWLDGAVIFGFAAVLLALFVQYDAFEYVVEFSDRHEAWELDEILTLLMVMSPAAALFAWRRGRETREELFARIKAEQEAQKLSLHDPLTGLPNRQNITEQIRRALITADTAPFTLALIDMDRFRDINELHGRGVADRLLAAVAERLADAAGPGATISRLSSNEFAVLLLDLPSEKALLSRLQSLADCFLKPFELAGTTFSCAASIGVTHVTQPRLSVDDALSQADAAMHRMKACGLGGFSFFETGMEEAALRRARIGMELAEAIGQDRIQPYYQPLVDLINGRIIGYEVLARWHLEDGCVRLPDDFISVAEDTGLINELYYSMLRQTAQEVRHWPSDLTFALNLSPAQFDDEWLVQKTLQILAEAGVAPGRMEIEITESALANDLDRARAIIREFKRQRIQVALDDFGTGYSSLRHLRELDFDKLKIDRSFIHDLNTNPTSQMIVRSVTSLAHSLGLQVTVEGIDSLLNADKVIGYGCDIGQGFLYGPPSRERLEASFALEYAA